jgi:hypothetical protein
MNTPSDIHSRSRRPVIVALVASFLLCIVFLWLLQDPRTTSTTARTPPQPSLIVTQFVAGGPVIIASQAPGGPLVIVTQLTVPTYEIQLPRRFYVEDGAVSGTEFHSPTHRPNDGVGMSLIDTRFEAPSLDLK